MAGEPDVHEIFKTNPREQLKLVGRFVEVYLSTDEVLSGTVYTIDPVSQSIVLVKREPSDELTLRIILKHSIAVVKEVEDVPAEQKNLNLEKILKFQENTCSKVNSKEIVKNWLEKNLIPVVEEDEKLIIDSVEIRPPYSENECYSSNPIVLSRIQKLIREMPLGIS